MREFVIELRYIILNISEHIFICVPINYYILSIQQCGMLYTLNLGFLSWVLHFTQGRFYFTGPTHSQMNFKLQTTTHSGRTIFQRTQAHWVWVDT